MNLIWLFHEVMHVKNCRVISTYRYGRMTYRKYCRSIVGSHRTRVFTGLKHEFDAPSTRGLLVWCKSDHEYYPDCVSFELRQRRKTWRTAPFGVDRPRRSGRCSFWSVVRSHFSPSGNLQVSLCAIVVPFCRDT